MKIKRLHELYVIKDNIHLTYKYKNQNKAIANAQSLQDKIINSIIDEAVYGNSNTIRNIDSTIEDLMTTTLENERKRVHHEKDRYVDRAVELNAEKYSKILSNRINTEAIKLQQKIESELRSGIHNDLSEAQTKKALKEKYGNTAKARIKNIIRDSVHTNESNISWINALNEGYNYKVWMNGAGKGRVRAWHVARYITPVPIEDYFRIHGPRGVRELMYPGDLYGGAENVANCRCWLRYTNRRPEGLDKTQTVFNIPTTSYLSPTNTGSNNPNTGEVKTKPTDTIKVAISNATEKVTTKIKKISEKITSKLKKPQIHFEDYHSDSNKSKKPDAWKTTNTDNLPDDVSTPIKDLIKEFESHEDKIFNGNEWGQVYNLTKDFIDEIKTDDHPDHVSPYKDKNYSSDKLIVIHNHIDGDPFSAGDLAKSVYDSENIVSIVIVSPEHIFIADLKYEGSIGKNNAQKVFDVAEKIYGEEWNKGMRLGVDSWKDIYDNMWERYKSDKTINKYIKRWRKIKK